MRLLASIPGKTVVRLVLFFFLTFVGAWCATAQTASKLGAGPDIAVPAEPAPAPIKVPKGAPSRAYFTPASAKPKTEDASAVPTGHGFGPDTAGKVAPVHAGPRPPKNWIDQSPAAAKAKSEGCVECHTQTDAHTMHASPNVVLGCTDCHGGNPKKGLTILDAHIQPRHPEFWKGSANPPNSTVALNHESPEFIQFMNPGDLRVAQKACGLCHGDIVERVSNSMMNHGGMLWNAAAYNNGAINIKGAVVGQAYGADGVPLSL